MFVDANIFLEILLEDARDHSCELFLLQCLEKKQPLFTSDFIVYACLLAIESRLPDVSAKMNDFITSLHSLHITILRPSLRAMEAAFHLMKQYQLDFDDALVLGCMEENKITDLVSYDKDFATVKGITVIKP